MDGTRTNLFDDTEPPREGERFETLLQVGAVTIERIVSSARPESTLYDQAQDEWVALLRGEATLEIAGVQRILREGDAVYLPARTPHRVVRTSSGALWLAVHVRT